MAKLLTGDIWTTTHPPHVYRYEVRGVCPQKSLIGGAVFDLANGDVRKEGSFVLDGDEAPNDWKLVKRVADPPRESVVIEFRRRTG